MKTFLAVFDGFRMSKSTLDYAIHLTRATGAKLVGVFLDEFFYRSYNVTTVIKTYGDYNSSIKILDEKDKKRRDEAAVLFQKTCEKNKIAYSIHRDNRVALQELKHESMFADLIIINERETFSRYKEKLPTRFMKDILGDIQCPVLVVPDRFKMIDKIVLLYDGGPSSLYAIKMFSYLFGPHLQFPVEVFSVKNKFKDTLQLPENKLMREFIKSHFPKASFNIKKGNAEEQISGYLRNHKENELVVLGAYRRSEMSRWFKTSMADILIKELDTPLFIAHNK